MSVLYFQNLVEEHKSGVAEDLVENMDLVLLDRSYSIQNNGDDGSAEYDALVSENVKGMVNILVDVVKPEAHTHVFCLAL